MTTAARDLGIRAATKADADWVTIVLAEAFLHSPVGDWVIPDPTIRYRVYVDYFRIFVDHTLTHGTLDITADLTGAALWQPHPAPLREPVDYRHRLADACGPWLRRFDLIDDTLARHHPDTAHDYLMFLGVVPKRQGEGIGSALLRHHHALLDAENTPAYLEASTPRSRNLYGRHGYHGANPFHLPEDGPPMWPMWRDPRDTSRATAEAGRA